MDKIEVTQADRESAASLWINVDGDAPTPAILQEAERYRQGVYDHTPAVQAFARHRLATRTDATPDHVAALVEALREVISATCDYLPPDGISEQECLGRVIGATDNPKIIAALAPFTKGQNDE